MRTRYAFLLENATAKKAPASSPGFSSGPANTWKGRTWIDRFTPAEENIMPFRNRSEAGRRLAVALAGYKEQEPTILALPRGGVAVAAEVAAALDAPLDLILVRKVGVP